MAKESKSTAKVKKPVKPATAKTVKTTTKPRQDKPKRPVRLPKFLLVMFTPFRATGRYVAGSWKELRQVFWPNRRATWSLTLAVILFTLFFTIIIVALDTAFQELFKRILL